MKTLFRANLFSRLAGAAIFVPALILMTGCFWREQKTADPAFSLRAPGTQTNLVIAPARSPVAHVASVNTQAKFAVINFPIGQLPADNTRLSVFRAGVKVGELRISGPAQETFTVGDIVAGSAQEGDEVRAE